jgi:anaerobic selenocysteine-containing dehydrogenase
MPSVHHLSFVLCDRANPPEGESLADYEIGVLLLEALEKRAAARGMKEFTDRGGTTRSLQGLVDRATHGGVLRDEEARFDEIIRDNAVYGILPKGTTLDTLRDKGHVRFVGWGQAGHGQSQASTIRPDEVHNPLRWHTEEKVPYDTLVRRAQFYIDHEWFLEAGEELPTHRDPPAAGGRKRRFLMTSGHNRWSIHSMNMTNNIILNTHRGEPFVFLNDADARSLGVANGERVKLVNNDGDCIRLHHRRQALAVGAARAGDRLQRLRALHAPGLVQPGRPGVGPRQAPGLRRGLRTAEVPRAVLAADSGGPGGAGGRGEAGVSRGRGPGKPFDEE